MTGTLQGLLWGGALTLVLNAGVAWLLWYADHPSPALHPRGPRIRLLAYVTGAAESLVFFASAVTGKPELAGGWLVFKLGTKWRAWQHIIEPGEGAPSWRDREAIATRTATRFLAGTACNLVAGMAAAYAVKVGCP